VILNFSPILLSFTILSSIQVFHIIAQEEQEQLEGQRWLTYENPSILGIKLEYPSDWVYSEEKLYTSTQVDFTPSAEMMNPDWGVSVYGAWLVAGIAPEEHYPFKKMPLELYIQENNRVINEGYDNVKILQSASTMIQNGSLPAHRQIFTYTYNNPATGGDMNLKAMQVLTVADSKPYFLMYSAETSKFENYLPTAQKMIDSFELIS
jgi:hypothetical protein